MGLTNTELNLGSGGDRVAVDDDGVQSWQYVKIAWGAHNAYVPVADASGQRLPVKDKNSDDNLTAAQAIQAAVELVDDAVYTDGTGTFSKGLGVMGQDGTNPQAIKTNTSGNPEIVGTGYLPVDLNAGSNAIGSVDVDAVVPGTGATQLGKAIDAAKSATGTGVYAMGARADTAASQVGADGDNTIPIYDASGRLWVNCAVAPALDNTTDSVSSAPDTSAYMDDHTKLTPKGAIIDDATLGNNEIVAAVVGKKIRVVQMMFIVADDVTVRFEDGAAGTALTGQMQFLAGTGVSTAHVPQGILAADGSTNTALNMELSAAVSVDGWLRYVEVD